MGCSSCGSNDGGSPKGCKSNGGCDTGGCNKLNTFDWLSHLEISDPTLYPIIEVSFKKGARKDFYNNPMGHDISTGDMVVVDSGSGQDVGQVSLSGELVRLQMKKKNVKENRVATSVLRRANDRDLDMLTEAREKEHDMMVKARVISRTLGLDMKIGDVEYQGDMRKATFYYTANGRVDFRELVRSYAKEFRIKIEMRQIGSRQESARIGGIGSCGRELCCSTWLSDFKSVSTAAARYQNIAINQAKLSGQCGRLKCCLNYELDTYMDALEDFPKKADTLKTKKGTASLLKMDIFKGMMYYIYKGDNIRGQVINLDKDKVKEIKAMNKKGEYPEDLKSFANFDHLVEQEEEIKFADVTGEIELPALKRSRNKKRRNNRNNKSRNQQKSGKGPNNKSGDKPTKSPSSKSSKKTNPPRSKNKAAGQSKDGKKPDGPKDSTGNKSNSSRSRNRRRNNKSNRTPKNDKE